MIDLTTKKCVACEGGTPPMAEKDAQQLLSQVLGWTMIESKTIVRESAFHDFKEAMKFVNRVAELAESEGHHPDILVHGWNKVRLELSTHAIGGLSENDFIMAAKINAL